MASVFGHSIAALTIGKAGFKHVFDRKLGVLAVLCACAPDLDVVGFLFGIRYLSQWGHRGFTHSLVFAAVFGWLVAWIFYRGEVSYWKKAAVLTLSTASHGLLDMLTDGGRGVAIFWPVSSERHFFPVAANPGFAVAPERFSWRMGGGSSARSWFGLGCRASLYCYSAGCSVQSDIRNQAIRNKKKPLHRIRRRGHPKNQLLKTSILQIGFRQILCFSIC